MARNEPLNAIKVVAILIITLVAYVIFASATDTSSFGLGSARNPEKWSLWRYFIVASWLLLAFIIFVVRDRLGLKTSLIYALLTSGVSALILAGIWIGLSSKIAVLGTAVTYTLIASLLCMTANSPVVASVLAVILIVIQVVVDIVVLGMAGQFRLH